MSAMSVANTLDVQDLRTWFHTERGEVKAVNGVSFSVQPGEVMGLVGESGSGKSMTGFSIMGLIDPPGRVVGGRVLFKGRDLLTSSEAERRALRGNRIAMIFQDPMMTLNPVLRIDTQMIEAVQAHRRVPRRVALELCGRTLERVGIAAPDERLRCYPNQLSGGLRQRVAIAIALLNEPDLIIADEPTTALDVTVQAQILFEMQKICAETGTSLIWITHDLSVVAGLADHVGVMYAGRLVEYGSVHHVLEAPRHPYTGALIDSVPQPHQRGGPLRQIRGAYSLAAAASASCAFAERCDHATASCAADPDLQAHSDRRLLRCHHPLPTDRR